MRRCQGVDDVEVDEEGGAAVGSSTVASIILTGGLGLSVYGSRSQVDDYGERTVEYVE